MTTTTEPTTTEQLLDAIGLAVKARDLSAVAVLLQRLAVQSPDDAQAVVDMIVFAGRLL